MTTNLNLALRYSTELNGHFEKSRLRFSKAKYCQIKRSADLLSSCLRTGSPNEDIRTLKLIADQFKTLKTEHLDLADDFIRPFWLWQWSDANASIHTAFSLLDRHYDSLIERCDLTAPSIQKYRESLSGRSRLKVEMMLARKMPEAVADNAKKAMDSLSTFDILEVGICLAKAEDRQKFAKALQLEKYLTSFKHKISNSNNPSAFFMYALETLEDKVELVKFFAETKPELALAHAEFLRLDKDGLFKIAFGFKDREHRKKFGEKCGIKPQDIEDYCERVSKANRELPDRIFERGICAGHSFAFASQSHPLPDEDTERRGRFMQAAMKVRNALSRRPLTQQKDRLLKTLQMSSFLDQAARILGFSTSGNLLKAIDIHLEMDELSRQIRKLPKKDPDTNYDRLLSEAAALHVSQSQALFPMSLEGFDRVLTVLFEKEGAKLHEQIKNTPKSALLSDLKEEMKPLIALKKKCPPNFDSQDRYVSKALQRSQGFQVDFTDFSLKEISKLTDHLKSLSDPKTYYLSISNKEIGHAIYLSFEKGIFVDPNTRNFETKLPIVQPFKSIEEFNNYIGTKYYSFTHFRVLPLVRKARPVRN